MTIPVPIDGPSVTIRHQTFTETLRFVAQPIYGRFLFRHSDVWIDRCTWRFREPSTAIEMDGPGLRFVMERCYVGRV